MLRNYLVTAYRNLFRRKLTTSIIGLGLVISLTFCLLTVLFVTNAMFWDRFHPNNDELYLLGYNFYSQDDVSDDFNLFDFSDKGVETNGVISYVHAQSFREEIPELQNSVLAYNLSLEKNRSVRINGEVFNESVSSAEPGLLAKIAHSPVYGNVSESEVDPLSVIISERFAKKHFNGDALNQNIFILEDAKSVEVKVGAVVALPTKSSFQFDILTNLETNQYIIPRYYDSQANPVFHFITQLPPGQKADELSKKVQSHFELKFSDFLESRRGFAELRPDSPIIKFRLIAAKDIHLEPLLYWDGKADVQQVMIVALFSALLIVLSAINYLLVTLGNLSSRIMEIGMRRVNGASSRHILTQFWIENSLVNLLSLIVAVCLLQLLLPYLESFIGVPLTAQFDDLILAAGLLSLILLLLCLMIGLYPAQVITRYRLTDHIKGRSTYKVNTRLINGLVTFQFLLCFVFISGSLMVNDQLHLMLDRDLGIDQDQVVYLTSGDEQLKQELLKEPEFQGVARGGGWLFGHGRLGFINNINGQQVNLMQLEAEPGLLDLFDLEIDWLEKDYGSGKVALINQETAELLGRDSLVFKQVGFRQRVVGVVSNAELAPLTTDDSYFFINPNSEGRSLWQTFVKIRAGQLEAGLDKMQAVWQKLYPNRYFEYQFLDQYIQSHYANQRTMGSLLNLITILGMVLSGLGLIALCNIATQNRIKEVGIRKVLGASIKQILILLNQSVIFLVLIAGLLSIPVTYLVMDNWLSNFSSHIGLDWYYFTLALLIGIGLAVLVMVAQTVRWARLNPVKLIKDE